MSLHLNAGADTRRKSSILTTVTEMNEDIDALIPFNETRLAVSNY